MLVRTETKQQEGNIMNTIEDFKNAPIGATATSPNGNMAFKNGRRTFEWFIFDSRGRPCDNLHNDEMVGFTLTPVAPTTAREALALAWEFSDPMKEGHDLPIGTECIAKVRDGEFMVYRSKKPFDGVSRPGWAEARTLDPLPDPEPDWLDAPAVLARAECFSYRRTWVPAGDGYWVSVEDGLTNWDALIDVTPLWPKEDA